MHSVLNVQVRINRNSLQASKLSQLRLRHGLRTAPIRQGGLLRRVGHAQSSKSRPFCAGWRNPRNSSRLIQQRQQPRAGGKSEGCVCLSWEAAASNWSRAGEVKGRPRLLRRASGRCEVMAASAFLCRAGARQPLQPGVLERLFVARQVRGVRREESWSALLNTACAAAEWACAEAGVGCSPFKSTEPAGTMAVATSLTACSPAESLSPACQGCLRAVSPEGVCMGGGYVS